VIAPLVCALLLSAVAGQTDDEGEEEESHLPEPLLVESVTDVDGAKAGELEMDVDFFAVPSTSNQIAGTRVEAEWRASERLGLAMELAFVREGSVKDNFAFAARASASYVLLHDFEHNFHLQAVGGFHIPLETDEDIAHDAAESALPYSAGLHAAWLQGPIELRAELLGEAGEMARSAHAPVHFGVAGLVVIDPFGYAGVEFIQDWALPDPFTIAPEIVLDGEPHHLPFRLGFVFPVHLGVGSDRAYNAIMRLVLELD
jgi:hypothetical protein